jgi:2-phosphosulfolactate phosphatase
MKFDQSNFNIRCEWGEKGIQQLAPISDAVIIIDVMSFSTCVTVATSLGAVVYPFKWKDMSSIRFASSIGAELAGSRRKSGYSLSPVSLIGIQDGARLVLPSPNGSTLSLATGRTPTYAGCLRNSRAVARAAMQHGANIAVVPAGERWKEDGSLRPAIEDLIGSGAVIRYLEGSLSPEAKVALSVYKSMENNLLEILRYCSSGKELVEKKFEEDIRLISQIDVDDTAPFLVNGAYVRAEQNYTKDI